MVYVMFKFLITSLLVFSANCFTINSVKSCNNKIVNKNPNIYIPYIHRSSLNKITMNHEICPSYLEKYTNLLNQDQSEIVVKKITGFLTSVDGFGGYVLHTNDVLINIILNNDYFPMERKKSIILFLIRVSQYGDSTGSHILQFYHDLVNCLL